MTGVLMFVPQYPYPVVGGLEKQAHELSRALIASGVRVHVLSGRTAEGQAAEEAVEGVPVTRVAWSSSRAMRFLNASAALAGEMWRLRSRFDVVHVHQSSWVALWVLLVAKALGKRTVAKLSNVGTLGLPGLGRGPLGPLKRRIFLSADAVVAMSRVSLDELGEAGFPPGRILSVPNGIDPGPPPAERDARDVCDVVFVGRLKEQKGLDVLLDAWATVMKSGAAAHLHIWGEGPLNQALRDRARSLGIEDAVTFAGRIAGVRDRLSAMDVFVLPSHFEGNSNAVLEAMAAGLPVVATDVGGTAMQVGEPGRDFLLTPGDRAGLARALGRLIDAAALRRQVGSAMRRRIDDHFDIAAVARVYAAAYGLIGEGRRDQVSTVAGGVILADRRP